GFGTELARGKEVRCFDGREHVLEQAIEGDLALVRADTADRYGNLTFRYAQMNFGPMMATAAKLAVAEGRTVLDAPIPHDRVQLPGVLVDGFVAGGKCPYTRSTACKQPGAPPRTSATEWSSISASACRSTSPTICGRRSTCSFNRRTA